MAKFTNNTGREIIVRGEIVPPGAAFEADKLPRSLELIAKGTEGGAERPQGGGKASEAPKAPAGGNKAPEAAASAAKADDKAKD